MFYLYIIQMNCMYSQLQPGTSFSHAGRQVVGQVKKVGKSRNFHQKVGKSRNLFAKK